MGHLASVEGVSACGQYAVNLLQKIPAWAVSSALAAVSIARQRLAIPNLLHSHNNEKKHSITIVQIELSSLSAISDRCCSNAGGGNSINGATVYRGCCR